MLEMHRISKRFGGVMALENVHLELAKGEILAAVGENGAGKSTLMKILSGEYPVGTYEGEITIEGTARMFSSVNDAIEAGVVRIPQELVTINGMTVVFTTFGVISK